jgi:hypothetical protein
MALKYHASEIGRGDATGCGALLCSVYEFIQMRPINFIA